jgi:hypothetical protein
VLCQGTTQPEASPFGTIMYALRTAGHVKRLYVAPFDITSHGTFGVTPERGAKPAALL